MESANPMYKKEDGRDKKIETAFIAFLLYKWRACNDTFLKFFFLFLGIFKEYGKVNQVKKAENYMKKDF